MEIGLDFILAAIAFVCIIVLFFYSDNKKKNGNQNGLIYAKVSSAIGLVYFVSILGLAVLFHSTPLVVLGVMADGIILILIGEIWV